jgi:hypothetical protein
LRSVGAKGVLLGFTGRPILHEGSMRFLEEEIPSIAYRDETAPWGELFEPSFPPPDAEARELSEVIIPEAVASMQAYYMRRGVERTRRPTTTAPGRKRALPTQPSEKRQHPQKRTRRHEGPEEQQRQQQRQAEQRRHPPSTRGAPGGRGRKRKRSASPTHAAKRSRSSRAGLEQPGTTDPAPTATVTANLAQQPTPQRTRHQRSSRRKRSTTPDNGRPHKRRRREAACPSTSPAQHPQSQPPQPGPAAVPGSHCTVPKQDKGPS